MTAPNAALAYRILDLIDAHPEMWRQEVYIGLAECGTVACFAGWACLLSGDQPDKWLAMCGQTGMLADDRFAGDRAQELLGASRWLTDATDDADDERDLFAANNSRAELGEYVELIFGPRPTDLAWRECAHRADYASAAEHDRDCFIHGTDADAQALQFLADVIGPPIDVDGDDAVAVIVDHGPVKPPYGTAERAAYDQAQAGDPR